MKTFNLLIALSLILVLFVGIFPSMIPSVHAQTEDGWTDPVNLSNSGSSSSPSIVIDAQGTIHVVWLDDIDGYKYVKSTDGIEWTSPKTLKVPFPVKGDAQLELLAGVDGSIHILWKAENESLQYKRADSSNLSEPSAWTGTTKLADSIVNFTAVVDSQGVLHVGYLNNLGTDTTPAGVYYKQLNRLTWSKGKLLYSSNYFRSLTPENANIHLATSNVGDQVNVYAVWDDRSQRRIFLAKSPDGGNLWDENLQVRGPDDFSGLELPYNVNLSVLENKVLLIWQEGIPEIGCVQYSQWSIDDTQQFGKPKKVSNLCPEMSRFLLSGKDYSIVFFHNSSDMSLMAWNGSTWSKEQAQNEIASFINPVTLESVFLGCQDILFYGERIYVVGCDTGAGGDIWFSSRATESVNEWFPPTSKWNRPLALATTDQHISNLSTVADNNNNLHSFWIQSSPFPDGENATTIQYAKWNGENWSDPTTVISGIQWSPTQLTVSLDGLGKILLGWVDVSSGDMFFTWANTSRANSASEWKKPIYIPSVSQSNSFPAILTDASGRVIITYAVSINEERGIYMVESGDAGATWSQPIQVFDASSTGWEMVDRPGIALTGDGRLHIIFGRYSLWGEQRQSLGFYYMQSIDGGLTWTEPEMVSEQPVIWNMLISDGKSTLHRMWQEQKNFTTISKHQFSLDGGESWSTVNTLSSKSNNVVIDYAAKDPFGSLYFFQMDETEELTMSLQKWDGSGWKAQEPPVLDINAKEISVSSMVANALSNGQIMASILAETSDFNNNKQNEILYMSQFLQRAESIPTPYPAMIPTSRPDSALAQQTLDVSGTTTASSPLAGLQSSQPFLTRNRNLIGVLLLFAILGFLFVIFWYSPRQKNEKK